MGTRWSLIRQVSMAKPGLTSRAIRPPTLYTLQSASGGVTSDTFHLQLTIDDPKAYTKPLTVSLSWELWPDTELKRKGREAHGGR
jgi:hypothetical protein